MSCFDGALNYALKRQDLGEGIEMELKFKPYCFIGYMCIAYGIFMLFALFFGIIGIWQCLL